MLDTTTVHSLLSFRQKGGHLFDWVEYDPESHLVGPFRSCAGGHLKGRPKKDSICYSRYSRIYSSLRRPTSSDQLCEEKLGELKMKWTAGVKSGPYRSVVVLAVILGMSSLSLSKSCKIDKTCTSIIVIDGNYTGPMEMTNSTCPNASGPSQSDKVCFFSFNMFENLKQELAEALKNSSTSYTTPTLTVSTSKTTTKMGSQANAPQTSAQAGPNILYEYSASIMDILEKINSTDKVNSKHSVSFHPHMQLH
ncbi:hypothetical protein SRHO_G00076050 [Serrasalmus rhombeus]